MIHSPTGAQVRPILCILPHIPKMSNFRPRAPNREATAAVWSHRKYRIAFHRDKLHFPVLSDSEMPASNQHILTTLQSMIPSCPISPDRKIPTHSVPNPLPRDTAWQHKHSFPTAGNPIFR